MTRMQPADPGARRRAITLVIAVAVIGTAAVAFFTRVRPAILDWTEHDPGSRLSAMLMLLGLITALPLLGVALYLWTLGRRIVAAERFPLPGQRTTRDVPVLSGEAARRRGRLAQGFGGAIAVLAVAIAAVLWRLAAMW